MQNYSELSTVELDDTERNETTNIDIVGNLPVEIAQEILLYLPSEDLRNAWFCSQQWRDLFGDNYIWKKKCEEYGYTAVKSEVFDQFTESKSFSYWEGVYKSNEILKHNWKNNIFKETTLHLEGSTTVTYLDDDWLIIVENSSKVVVVEYSTLEVKHCLNIDPEDQVRNVKKCNNLLFCLSSNYVLKVWNLQTGLIFTELSFLHPIDLFGVDNNRMAYFNEDLLRIFNIDAGIIEFQCNYRKVYQLFFYEDSLVLLGRSEEIHILNLNDKSITILRSCMHHSSRRVQIKNNYLLTYTISGQVCIYNFATRTEIHHNLYVAPRLPWRTKLDFLDESKFMYIDDYNEELHIWDVKIGICILKISNVRNIAQVLFNTRYIIASTFNKTIQMYCPSTGSLIGFVKLPSDLFYSHNMRITVTETKLLIQTGMDYGKRRACILDYNKITKKTLW